MEPDYLNISGRRKTSTTPFTYKSGRVLTAAKNAPKRLLMRTVIDDVRVFMEKYRELIPEATFGVMENGILCASNDVDRGWLDDAHEDISTIEEWLRRHVGDKLEEVEIEEYFIRDPENPKRYMRVGLMEDVGSPDTSGYIM